MQRSESRVCEAVGGLPGPSVRTSSQPSARKDIPGQAAGESHTEMFPVARDWVTVGRGRPGLWGGWRLRDPEQQSGGLDARSTAGVWGQMLHSPPAARAG